MSIRRLMKGSPAAVGKHGSVRMMPLQAATAAIGAANAAGANPTQAEYNALVAKHNQLATDFNSLLTAMQAAGMMSAS